MVLTRASAKAASAGAEGCDFAPTSDLYEAQDPSGNYGEPRMFWPASRVTGYDELSGVPQYEKRVWL